ncbi:Integrase, catalytic core protein [Phytophthora megakarya]|uniref:Integrase, catalytic core protein n=1 Tax=Phytophthora megakarya TaxID=4795 RepID=A0A225WCZ2_9STRA|nr:Integrase, catalytic core protein [Phytophthora megakarya]
MKKAEDLACIKLDLNRIFANEIKDLTHAMKINSAMLKNLVFRKRNGHYRIDATPVIPSTPIYATTTTFMNAKLMMWYVRFAHQYLEAMRKMVQMSMVDGMESLTFEDFNLFSVLPVSARNRNGDRTGDKKENVRQNAYARLMSDVCSVGITTPGGNHSFRLIQDETSRFKWCFMSKKNQANQNVMDIILKVEKEHVVKLFSSDGGGDFINNELKLFLRDDGIDILKTNSYTPEENCIVEKLNGTLMSKMLSITEAAGLPECLWGEVLGYVVEVDNMSTTKALNGMTPYEKLFGHKPQVDDLHVCGCVVFHHILKKKGKNKLDMLADPWLRSKFVRLPHIGSVYRKCYRTTRC